MNLQQQLEWVIAALENHCYWFDTCTKTNIEEWDEKANKASTDKDIALYLLKHLARETKYEKYQIIP